jgi:hypothetical protein
MEAIRLHKIVEKDGEIHLTDLPLREGQRVELTLLVESQPESPCSYPTARQLLDSGIVGLWEDREDIGDSSAFARELREKAQYRRD